MLRFPQNVVFSGTSTRHPSRPLHLRHSRRSHSSVRTTSLNPVTGVAEISEKLLTLFNLPPWSVVENQTPTVVIALGRNARACRRSAHSNWQPVPEEKAFVFETVVGEKLSLRIDEGRVGEDLYQSFFPNLALNRGHPSEQDVENKVDDEFAPLGASRPSEGRPQRSPLLIPQGRSNGWWRQDNRGSSSSYKGGYRGKNCAHQGATYRDPGKQ